MAKTVDDETYGDRLDHDPEEIKNGNPGKPQSDYEAPDPVVTDDPSEFGEKSGTVIPGSVREN
jgi:hypothetical protein